MNKSQAKYLTAAERSLVEQTVPRVLATFDEDELVALHDRVRRASTKYRTLYRRQSASTGRRQRSRGNAAVANEGTAIKSEIFEEALSRVSAALAKAARDSAKELKAQRLAAARGDRARATSPRRPARPAAGSGRGKSSRARGSAGSTRTPATTKRRASTQATGARRQAKRDAR